MFRTVTLFRVPGGCGGVVSLSGCVGPGVLVLRSACVIRLVSTLLTLIVISSLLLFSSWKCLSIGVRLVLVRVACPSLWLRTLWLVVMPWVRLVRWN